MVLFPDDWLSDGTLGMGTLAGFCERDASPRSMSWELPDPIRDEDLIHAGVKAHQCDKFTDDSWMCSECGTLFDRDPALGDYPEQVIIEGDCQGIGPWPGE